MRVTIILDSGGFLMDDNAGPIPLDVGYFETDETYDIEVKEDRKKPQPLPNSKLGKGNHTIDVQHLNVDGGVKAGVRQSRPFKKDILKKNELYPVDTPDFDASAYDCILRFHSGAFYSSDVRERVFKEHSVSDHKETGNKAKTRAIANDVLVRYELEPGEEVRLRRNDGTDLWSSSSVDDSVKHVKVKLRADPSLDAKYFGEALKHKGRHYHRPNPDPPPMNGNDPGPGGGG